MSKRPLLWQRPEIRLTRKPPSMTKRPCDAALRCIHFVVFLE
jgi:hypothetical protein